MAVITKTYLQTVPGFNEEEYYDQEIKPLIERAHDLLKARDMPHVLIGEIAEIVTKDGDLAYAGFAYGSVEPGFSSTRLELIAMIGGGASEMDCIAFILSKDT